MKKYTFKVLLIGVLLVSFNQSCTNLDEELFDEVRATDFFKTDEEFIAALGAAYTSLYGLQNHGNYFSSQEVASDEMMIPQRGTDWFDGGIWLRTHRHESVPTDGNVNNAWNFLFGGVNTCNRLLFQFQELVDQGQLDQSAADPFLAELKVLRGLWYLWLLDLYGNVPIVEDFDVPADFAPPTAPRADVYAWLEAELLENVPKLTTTVDGSTYARIQYYVGQAILAKLYLNAEVYKGSPEWEKAIAACDEIIDSGEYSLEANYFANFNTLNSTSSENIFVIPYDQVFAQGFNVHHMTLHYQSQNTFLLQDQPWNGYCSLQEFYNSYDDNDLRKGEYGTIAVRGNFFAGPQYAADGKTPLIDDNASDPGGPEIVFTPEVNELFPNCYRQAGVRVGKFEIAVGATPNLSNDFPIFRYADILLMKAEAMHRMSPGDAEALALVNQVRTRSFPAEPFTELTDENLLAERGREMFYEGWRRSDLIRFDKYTDEWFFKPASDETDILFPIPQPALDANPNLVQNPGYN